MKKIVTMLFFIVIAAMNETVQAQWIGEFTWRERPMRVGAALSGNVTTLLGKDVYNIFNWVYRPKIGYGAELYFNAPFAKHFNFQIELGYQALQVGLNQVIHLPGGGPGLGKATSWAQYISVPMLFQYLPNSKGMFFVNFGPELKFCVANKEDDGYPTRNDWDSKFERYDTGDIMYRTNRVVLAFNVGVGMHVPIAERWDFVWETRFAFDITNPRKKSEPFFVAGANTLVLSLHAGVVYRF